MKKVFTSLLAVLFASVINIHAALAAIYEAPFVNAGGDQVAGSEGKVNADGSYKVEILTGMPETMFSICRIDFNHGSVWLADKMTTDDGELKEIGPAGAILPGNYAQFSFLVSQGSGNDCSVPLWVSGFTLP